MDLILFENRINKRICQKQVLKKKRVPAIGEWVVLRQVQLSEAGMGESVFPGQTAWLLRDREPYPGLDGILGTFSGNDTHFEFPGHGSQYHFGGNDYSAPARTYPRTGIRDRPTIVHAQLG